MNKLTSIITITVLVLGSSACGVLASNAKYFHVDDFSGLGGSYAPWEGNQSLWCGLRPTHPDASGYVTAPGYGNNWDESWVSCLFPVSQDVTVSYVIGWVTESNYDFLYFEYLDKNSNWVTLTSYSGTGSVGQQFIISAANLNGTIRFRFRFVSNESNSDEDGGEDTDGACIIDLIEVKDGASVIDLENFETESPGDQVTTNGMWAAGTSPRCIPPCVQPPLNLVAWWPLDEAGPSVAYNIAGPDNAGHRCNLDFLSGKVGGSYRFTMENYKQGYAKVVNPTSYLDLGSGSFTIDAWIYPEPCAQLGFLQNYCHQRPIVCKHVPTWFGYSFYVDNDVNDGSLEGRLGLALNTQDIISNTRVVLDNQWQHVAVKVDRSQNVGTFYYNGLPFETFTPPAGNTNVPTSLHIGHSPSNIGPNCNTPP